MWKGSGKWKGAGSGRDWVDGREWEDGREYKVEGRGKMEGEWEVEGRGKMCNKKGRMHASPLHANSYFCLNAWLTGNWLYSTPMIFCHRGI